MKNRYVYYEPIYTSLDVIRTSVESIPPREMESPGRIYFKDKYLFINEAGQGIHVIDNSDPRNPLPTRFIAIPGNYDLAIIDNTLLADSYVDLVAFDITDVTNPREVGRLQNQFATYGSMNFSVDPTLGVVTDWKKREEITQYEDACDSRIQPWGGYWEDRAAFMSTSSTATFNKTAALAPGGSVGVAGSLARFALKDHNLFMLDGSFLEVVDVSKPAHLELKYSQTVAWDIETIFPHNDNLFIGSKSGMYIFSISNPAAPQMLSRYTHVNSCDPVVVEGNYAYVTLRDGNTCSGFVNQLEVLDISNLEAPRQVAVYPLTNPYGLGIDGTTLFVCDGKAGLKVFDATDVLKIKDKLLATYENIKALDIIPLNDVAMTLAEDGLYQYDYSDLNHIKELSRLAIVKPAQ